MTTTPQSPTPAATGAGAAKDWPEDFAHENGNYENVCHQCERHFYGHKRRITCKECATANETNTAATGMGDAAIDAKAKEMFDDYKDALAAPWERQWTGTRSYWRQKAIAALAAQPAPGVGGDAVKRAGLLLPILRNSAESWGNHHCAGELRRAIELIEALISTRPAESVVQCGTCNGHGMIGGPSYREPDEGGVPCPDCQAESVAQGGDHDWERQWREGWAYSYSGWKLYSDDGELQDNSVQPFIDWRKDSPGEIRSKIAQRSKRAVECAATTPTPATGSGGKNGIIHGSPGYEGD